MIPRSDLSNGLALDARGLDSLRLQARQDPTQAMKSVAQQFEAVFLQQLLKSMRDASPQDGLTDSDQTRSYMSMLDQQLATSLSAKGIGLADAMLRQMMRQGVAPSEPEATPSTDAGTAPVGANSALPPAPVKRAAPPAPVTAMAPAMPALASARAMPAAASAPTAASAPAAPLAQAQVPADGFFQRIKAHAIEASQATGIPAKFLLGQAALESGWGKREIRAADGSQSFNLFGIKASGAWKGKSVETMTTEFVDGVARKVVQKFRAYGSYAEAFQDYAGLMLGNRRYAAVLRQTDSERFAQGLLRAGYATDPAYADKLTRILNGSRLRQSLLA
jgi:flagellar protein FlgJ